MGSPSHSAVPPAFLHQCFLPATPAHRGIVVIVQDPITVDAKQTQNKELLMNLFLLTMHQFLGQLINAHQSLQQSSILTNYVFFNPYPLLSPTEEGLQEIAKEGVLAKMLLVSFSHCLCQLQVMLHNQGTTQHSTQRAEIPGRQCATGGYLILFFSLIFILSSLFPTSISQVTC